MSRTPRKLRLSNSFTHSPPNMCVSVQFLKGAKEGKTGAKAATDFMIAYNEKAFNKFDTEALIQCKNCQRTFLPDPLKIH